MSNTVKNMHGFEVEFFRMKMRRVLRLKNMLGIALAQAGITEADQDEMDEAAMAGIMQDAIGIEGLEDMLDLMYPTIIVKGHGRLSEDRAYESFYRSAMKQGALTMDHEIFAAGLEIYLGEHMNSSEDTESHNSPDEKTG